MNKSDIEITEREFKNLAGKSGLVYIPSQNRIVNTNSITEILSEEDARRENEGKSDEGILHDGLPVFRYFGNWYVKGEMEEVNGRLIPSCVVDPRAYPEIARDCVPSPKEYKEKYEALPREERLRLMLGGGKEEKRLGDGLNKISKEDCKTSKTQ
jgi:hypothetical protein